MKNLAEMSIEAGVPSGFQGCHIIKINGYVFEGHITSEIIKRLLAEHPQDVVGLSLPGMLPAVFLVWKALETLLWPSTPSRRMEPRRPTPLSESSGLKCPLWVISGHTDK